MNNNARFHRLTWELLFGNDCMPPTILVGHKDDPYLTTADYRQLGVLVSEFLPPNTDFLKLSQDEQTVYLDAAVAKKKEFVDELAWSRIPDDADGLQPPDDATVSLSVYDAIAKEIPDDPPSTDDITVEDANENDDEIASSSHSEKPLMPLPVDLPLSEPMAPNQWVNQYFTNITPKTFIKHCGDQIIRNKKLSSKLYQVALADLPPKKE